MSLKSLQERARELGIKRVTGINKPELIASIRAVDSGAPAAAPKPATQPVAEPESGITIKVVKRVPPQVKKRGRPAAPEIDLVRTAPVSAAKPKQGLNPDRDPLAALFREPELDVFKEPATEPAAEVRTERAPRIRKVDWEAEAAADPFPSPTASEPADPNREPGKRKRKRNRKKKKRGPGQGQDLFEGSAPVAEPAPAAAPAPAPTPQQQPQPQQPRPFQPAQPPLPVPFFDQVPYSTAPTVAERLAEITPHIGGLIVNEGTLELMPDGHGILRSINYHYAPSPDDIYVPVALTRKHNLRNGDTVIGLVRPPKVGERYFALVRVEGINGRLPEDMQNRPDFEDLLPVYPDQRYQLEHKAAEYCTRVIDLFAPVGKGTRGLIVAQPKTGKTTLLRLMANAVVQNAPNTKVLILLVDERPEEVTEMVRQVPGAEVIASTFDMKPENHKNLAELVFDKAKRLVEAGHDVFLMLDSITRLARAYNIVGNVSGRTMTGGIDSEALKIPRQLFSSARNIEGGGSLTIVASALVDTGSRMDDVIFEEFKGTGNMEIVLDRRISNMRVFPAIDVFKSGTRKEELIVDTAEREKVVLLRRFLTTMSPLEAAEFVLDKMKGTRNNLEFLVSMNQ